MRCVVLLAILFTGCAVTIKPIPVGKTLVVHHTRTKGKVVKVKAKPAETPVPKMPESPPFPPPNYDEVIRRTHPTPTISPWDFQ